jgi:nucleotide-binding universal stress UspA family protein
MLGAMTQGRESGFELGTDGPGVILVGLDASQIGRPGAQSSLNAGAYASGLARRQGARLVAVWVRPRVAYASTMAETTEVIGRKRQEAAAEARDAVAWAAEHYGIPEASLVIREGEPFEELTRVAEEVHADAIVVGSSAQRLGSLAVRLVKDARWPVTVVP